MMQQKLIETADGSHTIEMEGWGESYHSVNGAWTESMHVYIEQGFRRVLPCINPVKILEIGFGTGLNAYQTCLEVYQQARKVHYVCLEPNPLDTSYWSLMNYPDFATDTGANSAFADLHQAQWNLPVFIGENFVIHKIQNRLEEVGLAERGFHLVYFDAFSPAKQPELWTKEVMERMYKTLMPSGIMVTYAAKGEVRRNMEAVGFKVERLPGAEGKREMIRAVKPLR